MKILRSLFVAVAFLFLAVCIPTANAQQTMPPTLIGLVDMGTIVSKAKVYNQLRGELQKRQESLRTELDKKQDDLTKERDDLARQKTLLSPEVFKQRQEAFQQKYMTAVQSFEKQDAGIREAHEKANLEIQKKIAELSAEIAQERGFNMVMASTAVFYAIKVFDMTDEMLKRLDERLPKVTVPK
ncbi:MAG: OmpH family outer membrane protein [Pseudomonadota bacterium]